jgi:hypothetical protein
MTKNQLYEMTGVMDNDQLESLYNELASKDCTICRGLGHSYDWEEDYVESCECTDMGIIKYLMFQFYLIDHTIILLGL